MMDNKIVEELKNFSKFLIDNGINGCELVDLTIEYIKGRKIENE